MSISTSRRWKKKNADNGIQLDDEPGAGRTRTDDLSGCLHVDVVSADVAA